MEKYHRQGVAPIEKENERDENYEASNPQIDSERTRNNYRFTPHFYVDLAYVLRNQKDDVYAFAPLFDEEGIPVVDSWGAEMKTKTTRIALTLGYKF